MNNRNRNKSQLSDLVRSALLRIERERSGAAVAVTGTCPRHRTPLDKNGQVCVDCLLESRRGMNIRPLAEILAPGVWA